MLPLLKNSFPGLADVVASNRNRSPMEHNSTAVEHIHHAKPYDSELAPTRRTPGTGGDRRPCSAQRYGELPLPGVRI